MRSSMGRGRAMRSWTRLMPALVVFFSYLLHGGIVSSSSTSSSASTPAPTPSPTTSSSSSSSSSGTSRGTVVAWALFTIMVAVTLFVCLYSREQGRRVRIHDGDSYRQSLSAADALHTYGQQGPLPGHAPDPIMSSF